MSGSVSTSSSGHWDCHAHVFGPYADYPLAAERTYTPDEALEAQYTALLERLGMSHAVLVHPSAYGTDYRLVLDTLAARPQWRGVLVAQANTALDLKSLRSKGVRALRYSHRGGAAANFAGSASLDDLVAMAPALADAGLHAELWTDRQVLPGIADTLRALPVPVVVDHMAGFDANAGVDEPGFATLVQLLGEGRVWVKLCAYRNLLSLPTAQWEAAGRVFHEALIQANADQLVWGSDRPYLNVKPAPDAADLLALFKNWAGGAATIDRILQANPARLYG
ncbi:amidohydrolase family protein [Hydrogenophaga sp.]|uniref:amidohydrolase family protein n=1 Tax=Hydrogenophaga sp. TaxID=1904254 RepID=UPI00271AC4ED|nr:amidohydrolase family protein [Hydrogenophaga sp.]MDO9437324.1 amidohydrolase family protein [Hydrogenophaga sp.]